jgi:tol-pal system protein YbgF
LIAVADPCGEPFSNDFAERRTFIKPGGWRVKSANQLLGVVGVFMFLIGCAARDDIIILANRTTSLERNLSQIKDSQEESKTALSNKMEQTEKKVDSQLQPLLQNQANSVAQQEALKVQIQILQGRIEALEHNQKKEQSYLTESVAKEMKDLQARLQRLEKPPPPPPPAESGTTKPEKPKEAFQESKEEQKESKETVKEPGKAAPDDLFKSAQGLLQKQAYDGAKKKFEEYLKVAPKGKYVEEARFGLAESLYGIKDYEEAILTYLKLIKAYPKSQYIPEALYKQALSFISLKDPASARLLLEKIIRDYPKSGPAKKAKTKLKSL